jgi:hypothetical protein
MFVDELVRPEVRLDSYDNFFQQGAAYLLVFLFYLLDR